MTTPLKIIWFTVHFKQCHLTPFFYFFLFHTSKSWTCCVIRLLMVQFQNTPAADLDNWGVTFCLSFFFFIKFYHFKRHKKVSLSKFMWQRTESATLLACCIWEHLHKKKKNHLCLSKRSCFLSSLFLQDDCSCKFRSLFPSKYSTFIILNRALESQDPRSHEA